ncbi:hypothetical protein SARC_05733 [Sphaeroforma arctica JP610]|uniref:Proteasome assembly chaperone 4 n=1 Tax=Sphaeroforma arctica JP610 TaxID=667725 RepID=A0A0L0FZB1_9EUKA|nr:hypothetical protein SARC_05733 [Sphaeroforma arctica JP610]KNC81969.1 hypothetical protein SARC_05733 [Sphaeroforma arctica JP610]|eukprot:XP_014155871.1 hypothetical protein SARC_05733 [Sphaeroforma arctica JP610]
MTAATVNFVDPVMKVHNFIDHDIHTSTIYFRVIQMDQTLLLWAGTDSSFTNLAVAMPPRDEMSKQGVGSLLLGDSLRSTGPAQRLAKLTGKQIHLSINVSISDNVQLAEKMVEERFVREMRTQPEKF